MTFPCRGRRRRVRVAGAMLLGLLAAGAARPAEVPPALADVPQPHFCDTFFGLKPRTYLHDGWKWKPVPTDTPDAVDDAGMTQGFFRADFDDRDWEARGFPNKLFFRSDRLDLSSVREPSVAYLRRGFALPAAEEPQRAILYFFRLAWEPVVWVNGREVARPVNLAPGKIADVHEIDITDAVVWGGTNQIAVRLWIRDEGENFRDWRCGSGLWGPCFVELRPPVYCRELRITPLLPDRIEVRGTLVNTTGRAQPLQLEAEATPWQGSAAYHARLRQRGRPTRLDLPAPTAPAGSSPLAFTMTLRDPVLWDTFQPFLYSLKIRHEGALLGWERFGLRAFRTDGPHFTLNGRRIFLTGLTHESYENILSHFANFPSFNRNGALRRFLEIVKSANFNAIHRIESIPSPIWLDLCDELGILNLPTPDVLAEMTYTRQAEELRRRDEEAFLREAFRRNTLAAHNHPCVVTYTPEGEANRIPGITPGLHRYRQLLEEFDDSRLFSSAQTGVISGNDAAGALVPLIPPPPFDFVNHAALQGSMLEAMVHTLIPRYVRYQARHFNAPFFLGRQKPAIYTEALYYNGWRRHNQYWDGYREFYGRAFRDGELDKAVFCDLYGRPPGKAYWSGHFFDVKIAGLHNALDKAKLYPLTAAYTGEMVEFARMNDDDIQGFGTVSGPIVRWDPATRRTLDPAGFHENAYTRMFRRTCAPVFVCADYHSHHNLFAGREVRHTVHCFNQGPDVLEDARVEADLLDAAGAEVLRQRLDLLRFEPGPRRELAFRCRLPDALATGAYTMRLRLFGNRRLQSENSYRLFVMSRADAATTLVTDKRVGVIDGDNHYNYAFNPSRLLAGLGVQADLIRNTADLSGYDLVVIAQESVPGINQNFVHDNASKIRAEHILPYLENGGRVLCLEQRHPLPWLRGVEIADLGLHRAMSRLFRDEAAIGTHAVPVEPGHPVFRGLPDKADWAMWNDPLGKVFSFLAFPLSEGVILAGGTNYGGGEEGGTRFGMLIAEIRIGKGLLMLSQVEAMQRYGTDSVATLYLHNLFGYVLGDAWDGRHAAPLRPLPDPASAP